MAKRSRRARRQRAEKQRRNVPSTPAVETAPVSITTKDTAASIPATNDTSQSVSRRTVNFLQEYFYVYGELRNIFIIAVLMFVVLIGLSFVI